MRILHVNDLPPGEGGGAEIYLARLIAAQRAAGDEVAVVSAVDVGATHRFDDVWNRRARRTVAAEVRRFAPDIVNVHNVARELSASVLGATAEVPVVATVHDLRAFGAHEHPRGSARGLAERVSTAPMLRAAMRRNVRAFIAVSEPVARTVGRRTGRPVAVVPVPVDPPAGDLLPPGKSDQVLFAARLSADKGCHILLDAFASIADEVDITLLVAGDGPDRDALTARAAGFGDRVRFLGRLDGRDLSAVMSTVRAVVVPSIPGIRPEGSSLTAAEGARHGRPVIGSDDPAVAEVVRAVGGVVVRAADPTALADVLRQVCNDARWADETGARAAALAADRYDAGKVAAAVRDVYRAAEPALR